MRANRVEAHGDPSVLSVADVDPPEAGPGQVVVDVAAAGVNFADLLKRRGEYPGGPTPPYTPGIAVAGTVAEPDDAGTFDAGDRVMAYTPGSGGYAERVAVDADSTFPVPDPLSLVEAAAVPVQWLTAHNALFEWGDLAAGERVLVLAAAGGVGSAAVQLADGAGATVVGTASTEGKREYVRDLGADAALGYDDLEGAIEDATDGAGVDLALDGVGGEAFDAARRSLAHGGTLVAYGIASGDVPRVSTPRLIFDNLTVRGYHLGRATAESPERVLAAAEGVTDRLAAGDATVRIDRTFPLEEAAAAHEYVADRHTTGSVVLEL